MRAARHALTHSADPDRTPSGWIRESQASLAEWEQDLIGTLRPVRTNVPPVGILPILTQNGQQEAALHQRLKVIWPQDLLIRMLAPGIGQASTNLFRAEQCARSTGVAFALERRGARTAMTPIGFGREGLVDRAYFREMTEIGFPTHRVGRRLQRGERDVRPLPYPSVCLQADGVLLARLPMSSGPS